MFGKRLALFELFGFKVHVDISWVLLAVLVTWSLAAGYFPVRYPDLTPGLGTCRLDGSTSSRLEYRSLRC